jgi:hypothetical protein
MDTSLVVGVGATLVAFAALVISVHDTRFARVRNPHTMRPVLELSANFDPGRRSGLRLVNRGFGPAVVIATSLTLDDEPIGAFDESTVDRLRDRVTSDRPAATTLGGRPLVATGHGRHLLSVEDYDPEVHDEFADLVRRRLTVEILYQSLYGGDSYIAAHTANRSASSMGSTEIPRG